MGKLSLKLFILLSTCIFPALLFAQGNDPEEKGLDQRIDEGFAPVANWFERVVFFPIRFTDTVSVPFIVILLVCGALFFTIYFSFVNIRKFPLAIRVTRGKYDELELAPEPVSAELNIVEGDIVDTIKKEGHHGEVNHFQALATAVSGTVGLGNIAGVAVAVAIGGPGATFWMIVCGLLGMSSKFVECTLGVKYRDIDAKGIVYGGPMYYLSKGLKERKLGGLGKFLAVLFAVLCVGGSFGGGNAFQSNQATQQIVTMVGAQSGSSGFIVGLILATVTGIVIIGGIKRIAQVTEKIVPFMAILYILASLVIIFMHFGLIDDAFGQIVSQAFTPAAGVGGFAGVLIQGFRRAAFSNEAGAGSAAIAHSAVRTKYPASEGIVSLLEPFIDTVVICTMTALVIVIYNMQGVFTYGSPGTLNGVDLTSAAYNDAIPHFSYVLTVAIVLFAFSTMISWSYYGLQAWKYLFGRSFASDLSYKLLFLVFVIVGASATLNSVISFSDAMILAMVFPNMIGLLLLFPKVRDELNRYLNAIKEFKPENLRQP
ncbi:MAG TPA: alanine/glycine:cation symporter family protein [Chitinophagaceae bacterium]|nr:alanine/glycine:cation symporter family protein [Chitinophagaceae bacterium]